MEWLVVEVYFFKLGVWILNKVLIIDFWFLFLSFIYFIFGMKFDYLNFGFILLLELFDFYLVG